MTYTADMFEVVKSCGLTGTKLYHCEEHGLYAVTKYSNTVLDLSVPSENIYVCLSHEQANVIYERFHKEALMATTNVYWQVFFWDQDDSHTPSMSLKDEYYTRLQPAAGWFEIQEHAGLGFDECWTEDSYPLQKMSSDKELSSKFPRSTSQTWMYDMEPYGRMRLCSDYDDRFQYHGSYSDVWDCNGERMCVSYNGRTIQGVHLDDIERRMEIANLSPYGGWNL